MVSEGSDPFDGSFPSPSHMQEPDTYDDLLGIQIPIESLDLPMPDIREETAAYILALDKAANADITMGNSDTGFEVQNTSAVTEELLGFNANAEIGNLETVAIERANSSSEPIFVPIKKEAAEVTSLSLLRGPCRDLVIELSDSEEVVIKKENAPFHWTSMIDDTISISSDDNDDDVAILQDVRNSVRSYKKTADAGIEWESLGGRVIELGSDDEQEGASTSNLGKPFLGRSNLKGKRTPIDRERAMRAQELHKERLRKQGKLGPAGNRGMLGYSDVPSPATPGATKEDKLAWMKAVQTSDEDAGQDFKELKRDYMSKVKTNSNTVYNDMDYWKAERAENVRLHNSKTEYEEAFSAGSTDDSDKDEEGLFLSPSSKRPSSTKRGRAPGNEGDDTNQQKEPNSRKTKKQKPNGQGKRRQEDLDEDETANMLAGVETYLATKKFADENQAGNPAEQAQGLTAKPSKTSKGKKGGPKKSNRKANGHWNDVGNLLYNNVFDDATANNDRDALPVSSETDKRKAMKAIVANVPLENKREAKDDKAAILKATVTLASRKVTADGQGGWKLQGMASSLHNHQILGASFMKVREVAGQQPLGGIMADGMVRLSNAVTICHTAISWLSGIKIMA